MPGTYRSSIMIGAYNQNIDKQLARYMAWVQDTTLSIRVIVVSSHHQWIYTVLLIYNFTFTCVYTHGTMQYLASKNPWFAVEKFFSTRRVVASRTAFHDMSLGISMTHVISTRSGFPRNESWHLHAMYMTVVIHTVIQQTNPPQISLWL